MLYHSVFKDTSLFVRCEAAYSIIVLGDTKNLRAFEILKEIAMNEDIVNMTGDEMVAAGEDPLRRPKFEFDKTWIYTASFYARKRAIQGLLKSDADYVLQVIDSLKNDRQSYIRNWAAGKE